jgi:hypothetical protein
MPKQTKKKRKGIEKSPPESENCKDCGDPTATYDTCPFAVEIHDDYSKLWLCTSCRMNRMWDI